MSRNYAATKLKGQEHWTKKGDVNLFLWDIKRSKDYARTGLEEYEDLREDLLGAL